MSATELFAFDSAKLNEGQPKLDDIATLLNNNPGVDNIVVTGYADRIGSKKYNQKLSERRAATVRDYLASQGVAKDKIETLGMGKTQPVPGVKCEQKNRKELIACLQPHRRVEVEVKGEMTVN